MGKSTLFLVGAIGLVLGLLMGVLLTNLFVNTGINNISSEILSEDDGVLGNAIYSLDIRGTILSADDDNIELETESGVFIFPVPETVNIYINSSATMYDAPVIVYERYLIEGQSASVTVNVDNGIPSVATVLVTTP